MAQQEIVNNIIPMEISISSATKLNRHFSIVNVILCILMLRPYNV